MNKSSTRKTIGLLLGPFLFLLVSSEVIPIEGLSDVKSNVDDSLFNSSEFTSFDSKLNITFLSLLLLPDGVFIETRGELNENSEGENFAIENVGGVFISVTSTKRKATKLF